MMAICFWEATFNYKSYDLSDWYQFYISCKNNIETAITYPTNMKPSEHAETYFTIF